MSKTGAQAQRAKTQNGNKDLVIRKMEPSFPFGIRSIQADGIIVIDFIGDEIAQNKRESFASVVLSESIARDLISKLQSYIAQQEKTKE